MIVVSSAVSIPDDELVWTYSRSGGPGGQNVNKVESKAHLRWRMAANTTVPVDAKARIRSAHPARLTTDGDLVISSQQYRDQPRNRDRCVEKLVALVAAALRPPKRRKATKPSAGSVRRRLADKKQTSQKKASRRSGKGGSYDD